MTLNRVVAIIMHYFTESSTFLDQYVTLVEVTPMHAVCNNKKLRYREEHSASVVLSWCTL